MSQAANARLVHLNEQLIFPLLDRKIAERMAAMCEQVKKDGTASVGDVAYIAALRDLHTELIAITRQGDRASEKLGHNPDL